MNLEILLKQIDYKTILVYLVAIAIVAITIKLFLNFVLKLFK